MLRTPASAHAAAGNISAPTRPFALTALFAALGLDPGSGGSYQLVFALS